MSRIDLKPLAKEDLIEIWQYIAEDNPNNADKFIDSVYEQLDLLSDQPCMGKEREDLATGLYYFPLGNYNAYYTLISNGIEVIRILHGKRDTERFSF